MTTIVAHDLEAEEHALAAAAKLGPNAADSAREAGLTAADFYRDSHRAIFCAITKLADAGGDPNDVQAVIAILERDGQLEAGGGQASVMGCLSGPVPALGNADLHLERVATIARTRRIAQAAQRLAKSPDDQDVRAELRAVLDAPANGLGLQARSADLTRVRPTRWAWERRLPLGYLSLLLGAEGIGKGTLIAWVVARLTRGELPGDLDAPARVLIVGDEDGFDSVVAPRLYAAGADLTLVDTLTDDGDADILDLRRDASALRDLLHDGDYKAVIVDQLLDTLGVEVDDWRAKQVRDAIRPLRRTARELEILALGALHPNKGTRTNFRDLVSGTHAFNALSRSSLLLTQHPDDQDRRILVRGKGNLSAPPPSFEFAIDGRDLTINGHGFSLPLVADVAEGDTRVEDLLTPPRDAPVRDTLSEQIDAVGTGAVQTRADIARAVGREPDDRSVGRALDRLEADDRWEKVGRGQWRRFGIGTSSEAPMSKLVAEAGPNGQEGIS